MTAVRGSHRPAWPAVMVLIAVLLTAMGLLSPLHHDGSASSAESRGANTSVNVSRSGSTSGPPDGSLPLPVEIIEQRTVGPTLGADAIDASARAAVIGLGLTALFLLAVYRLAGLVLCGGPPAAVVRPQP